MKYLCLGYLNPEKMNALPAAEIEALLKECQPHMAELYKTGQVIIDAGLDAAFKCLRGANGKVTVTDGPSTEAKEVIGSAFLIEADTMEDAIGVAALHPTTQIAAGEQLGWRIEIRPIHYFKG